MKDFNAFLLKSFKLAGDERFELPNDGVRDRCLTAWRIPNIHLSLALFYQTFRFLASVFIYFFQISSKKA